MPSLVAALTDAARVSQPVLAEMSAAATAYASSTSWPEIAARTLSEMASLLGSPAEGAHITKQRPRAIAPGKPARTTLSAGPTRLVRIAVIIPAGPRDDILDTLASVVQYTDPSRVVLVIDDSGASHARSAQIRELSGDIVVIPAPATVPGVLGGLWVKVAAGYAWVLERFRPGIILRMDADALMLGTGIEAAAEKALASEPGVRDARLLPPGSGRESPGLLAGCPDPPGRGRPSRACPPAMPVTCQALRAAGPAARVHRRRARAGGSLRSQLPGRELPVPERAG